MPDGSISVPSSNSYSDLLALDAVSMGGVREEMYHVNDMRRLQRDQRSSEDDELTDRCMVIDYDQQTILNRETLLHSRLQDEDRQREAVNEHLSSGRVYLGGEYYEKVRSEYERNRGRGNH